MTAPDTLPPELEELGQLLREEPPRPDPAWARSLDDRAAAGFPRPPRRSWWARLVPERSTWLPAMGIACVVALLVGVVAVSPKGGDESASSGSGGGSAASSSSAESADPSGGGGGGGGARATKQDSASPAIAPTSRGGGSPSSD